MWRACSSDVRSVSFLGRNGNGTVAVGPVYRRFEQISTGAIEAETANLGCNGRRARGRRSAAPHATRSRTSDEETASGVIGKSSTRSGRASDRTTRSRVDEVAARPCRCADASQLEHPIRVASRSETQRARRHRSETRGHARPSASSESTVRPNGSRETSASSRVAKASSASASLTCGWRLDDPCDPGSATTRTSRRDSAKWSIASRARATCPSCGGSNAPPKIPTPLAHSQTTTSSPISTSEPRRTPASRSAASSSSPSGAIADDAETLTRAENAELPPLGRTRPVLEKRRELLDDGIRLGHLVRAEREEQRLELVDPGSRRARDAMDGDDALVLHGERRRLGVEIRLVENDELRTLAEAGAVGRELAVDHAPTLVSITLGCIDHVEQETRALEVGEKLVPEADPFARPLDQSRHIGDGQLPAVAAVDRPEHRRQRRERIVRDLRLRVRDPAQERRLAGIRQPGAGSVGHQLEMELELERLSRHARSRRTAASAGSASRSSSSLDLPRPRVRARFEPRPHADLPRRVPSSAFVICVPTGTVSTTSAPSAPCFRVPLPLPPRLASKTDLARKDERSRRSVSATMIDVAAAAAVATVRPALGHELLAAEAEPAVTATAGLDANPCAIVEHAHSLTSSGE